MRINFGSKPIVYPMPVFIISTYCENGKVDAMNAAWGCVCDVDKIAIFVSKEHKTMENILKRKYYVVSIADEKHVIEADYFGIVSANDDEDKFSKTALHSIKSSFVDAPIIEEFPLALECELISYDEESECLIGKILNVSIDESILNENKKIDLKEFIPISYDTMNHTYLKIGDKVADAFKVGKKLIK